jgi:CRP/FNR family cyclic AMP-dependent transcriptional regulator
MDRLDKHAVLDSSSLFEGISRKSRDAILSFTRSVVVPKKGAFFLPPESEGGVHWLASGRMKIVRLSPRGRELILEIIEPGEIFGELSVLGVDPRAIMAEAMERSVVGMVARRPFNELLQNDPSLNMKFVKLMARKRRDLESRLENLVFRSVPGRLAQLLLHLGRVYGVPDNGGIHLRIWLSQQDMGNLIGASREVVSLTLSDFRRRGFIDVTRRRLVIRRPRPLEQL